MEAVVVNSIIMLGVTGLIFGMVLGFAAKKFAVKIDEKEEALLALLPGVNCGACGYPGCSGYAAALSKGEAPAGKCTVASADAQQKIQGVLGLEAGEPVKKVAIIKCAGGEKCKDKMVYTGIKDCRIATGVFGGNKECTWGCLGFGNCAAACPFGAITYTEGQVPQIDAVKCTGCGLCVAACPKNIITLVPCKYHYHVLCASQDKGALVRTICPVGCIGCGICVKVCPEKDIVLENNVARIKYENCTNCGVCFHKCPTKSIQKKKSSISQEVAVPKKAG